MQWVNRPNLDFRGFAGTIASGIVRRGDEVVILDDRSMNGVWVNEERITEAPLQDGDEIRLGRVPLLFRTAVPEAAAA